MSKSGLERKRIQGVAREYRKKDYHVLLYPDRSNLPDFLLDFQPDMIALGEEENVVVEVKSKATLSKASYLKSLASAVDVQPGWRFELVVTNPVRPTVVEDSVEVLSSPEIEARIQSVRQLLDNDQEEAATVLAWSAMEAVLRLLAQQQGVESQRRAPLVLIKELYSLGIIGRDDYELLEEGMQFRNVIVHGFRSTQPTSWLVDQLVQTAEKLLRTKVTHLAG